MEHQHALSGLHLGSITCVLQSLYDTLSTDPHYEKPTNLHPASQSVGQASIVVASDDAGAHPLCCLGSEHEKIGQSKQCPSGSHEQRQKDFAAYLEGHCDVGALLDGGFEGTSEFVGQ